MGIASWFERWTQTSTRFVPPTLMRPRVVFLTCPNEHDDANQRPWESTLASELFFPSSLKSHARPQSTLADVWQPTGLPGPRFEYLPDLEALDPVKLRETGVVITCGLVPSTLVRRLTEFQLLHLKHPDDTPETMLQHLYRLHPTATNRHVIHALRINSEEHLAPKRFVALSWCRILARVGATRALVPISKRISRGEPSLTASPGGPDVSFWHQKIHQAVLDCYGLAQATPRLDAEADPSQNDGSPLSSSSLLSTLSPLDLVQGALRAAVSLKTMRSWAQGARRWHPLALRQLPRSAMILGALAAAQGGLRDHKSLHEYGKALVDLAEAHWKAILGSHES